MPESPTSLKYPRQISYIPSLIIFLFSPVVVEDDAHVEIAAKRIAWGKWMNCGQTCLAPDYILTTPSMKSKLIVALKAALDEFYGSDAQKSKDYSRIISHRHFE